MLASLYDLEQFSINSPTDLDWTDLPLRCVIQIHQYPQPEFLPLLDTSGTRVIMPIRHPFDVLISYLNYIYYIHEEASGETCTCGSCQIAGVSPGSEEFIDYATGFEGRSLLCYGPAWVRRAPFYAFRLRYEDLVAAPEPTLLTVAEWLGEPYRRPIDDVVESNSIGRRRAERDIWHYHFWQGQPGLWRKLLTAENARRIARGVPEPFIWLGYECDPNESLSAIEADLNWHKLQVYSMRDHLRLERTKHRAALRELEHTRSRLAG
jgi:hypothetical protein